MNSWRTALVATMVSAACLVASPASAQQVTVHDASGDAANHGLDITSVRVRNLDHKIVTTVSFARSVRGDLIVSIDPRRATGIRLVSEYRPVGHTNNLVVAGAFTDKHQGGKTRVVKCKGFHVTWSPDTPTATLRLPAHCLHGGDYGAIRFGVLTERGSDSDYAPQTPSGDLGSSAWIPRG
jgi:hypothetical protein